MRRIIYSILLALLLCLASCELSDPSLDEAGLTAQNQTASDIHVDTVFGVAYTDEAHMNPLTTKNKINLELYGLVFEGLFQINQSFEPINVLCESYEISGNTYRFKLKSGVTFSDGSALRASDVVASLKLAMQAESYYASRLKNIANIRAENNSTVLITVKRYTGNLPRLLDVPIIKRGTETDKIAIGTGAYVLKTDENSGGLMLLAREGWHMGKDRPYARIELTKVSGVDELIFGFESRDIDVVSIDSTSADPIRFRGEYESREFPTTILQYLGFNTSKPVFANSLVRRGIACAIDRQSAAEQEYARLADITLLPVHPTCPAYNADIAKTMTFSLENARGFLTAAGYTGDGKPLKFSILVNAENKSRCAVAERISADLAKIGVTATVNQVSWDAYIKALQAGNFDTYIAEVNMSADFDCADLIRTGGVLNYGRYSSADTDAVIDAFNAATIRKSVESDNLFRNFTLQAPICPILFKKNTIITHRGFFDQIHFTQRNLYYNFYDWKPVKH